MKQVQTAFKFLTALALAMLAVGCAGNNLLDKENVAVGAGFKVITPRTPQQMALLRNLPADKFTRVTLRGKPCYVLPDVMNNRAYVGGPKQFQLYKKLRRIQLQDSKGSWSTPVSYEVVEYNGWDWEEWDGTETLSVPDWY